MANNKTAQLFHSGKYLQKLRELQGLSISELAIELKVGSVTLENWESEGVPTESLKPCSQYFEVSESIFRAPVKNQSELVQLVRTHLFPQNDSTLKVRLDSTKQNRTALLDLSSLGLSEVPAEVFEFYWLTTLNISDNQLKQLPSSIVLLKKLETLDISNNFLPQIPGIICAISNLKVLNFQGNPLSLQESLLQTPMTLSAYQTYVMTANICMVVIDQLTTNSLQNLDTLRETIEKTQVVIMTSVDTCCHDIEPYKQLLSLIYITENNNSDYLIKSIDTFLPKQVFYLLIVFSHPLTEVQNTAVENSLSSRFPTPKFLVQYISNIPEWFSPIYLDIQQRIAYQKQLPSVKFERLELSNIGVYEQLEIAFNSDLTVLIGLNGAGKTTILKALALATLGPEQAEINANTAVNLLRIQGKKDNKALWQAEGVICLHASINGKPYNNTIRLIYNTSTEQVEIKGRRFDELFNADGNLLNLMLGIGEQRNTNLKKTQSLGLEVEQPKVKDLLPIISGEEQACIAHFTSWLGNLALSSQVQVEKQQQIDACFAIFSALMQESIQFAGLTSVDPLELWVEHQNPKQIVPLRLVSQGYQAVMGWVGHIIQRMFEAYADALQPLQQPAIIIIDEIDQLLHIKWQQKIINVLAKEFFPNTQWIVTTHSPMVVMGLDQGQVIQLHQHEGKMVAEPNAVDLWLWQYGDIVRYLFEIPLEKPQVQEQQLVQDIETLKSQPKELSEAQQQALEKLEVQLEKVQKSRAFVDELYAEQQKLRAREQELSALIKQLSQK